MSGGSVRAHMTDAKDAADKGGAPLGEQKKMPKGHQPSPQRGERAKGAIVGPKSALRAHHPITVCAKGAHGLA